MWGGGRLDGRSVRQLVAASALLLGLVGLALGLLGGGSDVARSQSPSDQTYEVWITANAFNPASCTVRRGDNVRWVNKDSVVRAVVFNNLTVPPSNEPWESGDLQPGQISETLSFDFIGSNGYHEKYAPALTGSVATTDRGTASCAQLPPTPTPTSTPTATPVAPTPTPTPPRSPACGVQPGCAVIAAVSRDKPTD